MWSLSLLLAFCLCVSSQIYTEDDLEQWVWIKGRYEDDEPTPRQYFQVFVRDRIGVYASANFNIFSPSGTEDDGEDWYVGFSYNFDQVTHNISSHYITWSLDDEYWSDAGVQPENYDDYDVGVDGYGETYSSINYFNTLDGELWAYHAFVHADDVDERYPDPITFEGNSLLYRWAGSNFEDEPTYTVYSQQATTRSMYFNTPDGREYLWTANFEEPYTRDGTPNCTLHEYGTFNGDTSGNDGGWRMVYGTNWNGNFNGNGNGNFNGWYFNCSKFPRAPLVFTTEDDQWLYMDVTYATATWNVDGSLATMSTTGIQQNRWWSEDDNFNNGNNNGYLDFGYLDVMDNLYFDNVNTVDHFVASGFDYLIAMNDVGISTWRMHWVTHRAQELPFLQTVRPPTHAWLFNFLDHTCMSVSLGQYTGLNAVNGNSIQDQYFEIYCWDDIHDRWNLAIRIPSFGVIKTQTFMDDGRLFLVALSNVDHPAQNTFITYELEQWYDDDYIVTREVEIDDYEMYWKIVDMHEILDDLHHYKNMIIATLSLLATVFVLQIILLLKGMSGGSGSSGDYQSFS